MSDLQWRFSYDHYGKLISKIAHLMPFDKSLHPLCDQAMINSWSSKPMDVLMDGARFCRKCEKRDKN